MSLATRLRGHHLIEDRGTELIVGFLIFAIGCLLLYDAFETRGNAVPWPMNKFVPW